MHFNYVKIQKRCFSCQRLNHDRSICPLLVKKCQEEAQLRKNKIIEEKNRLDAFLMPSDPQFGVLKESQVKINPLAGRPKIFADVLEEMCRYLVDEIGEDKSIKMDKKKKTVREAELDPVAQRTVLKLKFISFVTLELNRRKGLVFHYGKMTWSDATLT